LKKDQISIHGHSSLAFPEILAQNIQDCANQTDAEAVDWVCVKRGHILVLAFVDDIVIDQSIQKLDDGVRVQHFIIIGFSNEFDHCNPSL